MGDQDRVVVAGKGGDLAIEVLERKIDLKGARVFHEELAHNADVDRRMDVEH